MISNLAYFNEFYYIINYAIAIRRCIMIKFKDFLLEQAKAMEGDLEDYRTDNLNNDEKAKKYQSIRTISKVAFENNWDYYGEIKDNSDMLYSVYKSGNHYSVVSEMNKDGKDYYLVIIEAELESEPIIGNKFNLKNPYKVSEIISIPRFRGAGLATNLYKLWVAKGINLIGDEQQYFGARKLWSKLSKESDIIVDIIDISSAKYVEKNTVIHHGELDGDFDKRVWTTDDSKWNIRLLLRDIL